jgi:hypothetical protein
LLAVACPTPSPLRKFSHLLPPLLTLVNNVPYFPFFSLCAQGKLFFSVARAVKQKEKITNATINPATPTFEKNLFI